MAIELDLDNTIGQLNSLKGTLGALQARIANQAFSKAIRNTIKIIRKNTLDETKRFYTSKEKKAVKTNSWVRGRAGRLSFRGRRGLSLQRFLPSPARMAKKRPVGGVSTKVKTQGKRYVRTENGNLPFFAKNAKSSKGKTVMFVRETKKRLPIKFLFGPSQMQHIASQQKTEDIIHIANVHFPENLRAEIDKILTGAKK